jgi:hypothetical protein
VGGHESIEGIKETAFLIMTGAAAVTTAVWTIHRTAKLVAVPRRCGRDAMNPDQGRADSSSKM